MTPPGSGDNFFTKSNPLLCFIFTGGLIPISVIVVLLLLLSIGIGYLFVRSKESEKEYSYARAKIPLRSPTFPKDKVQYEVRVRYNEDEMQIYGGKPKNVGWKKVKSDKIEQVIRKQL